MGIRIPAEIIAEIDARGADAGESRSQTVRRLLELALIADRAKKR